MNNCEDKPDPKTQPEAKAAFADRGLSDAELETVAGAGDNGKQDPNQQPPPPPPAGKA